MQQRFVLLSDAVDWQDVIINKQWIVLVQAQAKGARICLRDGGTMLVRQSVSDIYRKLEDV